MQFVVVQVVVTKIGLGSVQKRTAENTLGHVGEWELAGHPREEHRLTVVAKVPSFGRFVD